MNQTSFRLNDSYYLDSLPYSSYNTNSYPFRSQTHPTSSNVYFSSNPPSFSSSSQLTQTDVTSYSNYETTYLNVAVAAAYQNGYQNHYPNNTITDSFDMNFSRHMSGLYGNSNEQQIEADLSDQKASTSIVQSSKKRKFQDETMSKCDQIRKNVLAFFRNRIRI
jgi:hypothetical protein